MAQWAITPAFKDCPFSVKKIFMQAALLLLDVQCGRDDHERERVHLNEEIENNSPLGSQPGTTEGRKEREGERRRERSLPAGI